MSFDKTSFGQFGFVKVAVAMQHAIYLRTTALILFLTLARVGHSGTCIRARTTYPKV